MIKEAIHKVLNGSDLTYEEAKGVMEEMMDGTATQAQMGGIFNRAPHAGGDHRRDYSICNCDA